jgi:nitrogen fixation protein NifU and related proteins
MNDSLYKEIIMEHWQNPANWGVFDDADIDITEENELCGDKIRITFNVKNYKIQRIGFVCEGCAISKAAASIMTEWVLKKKIAEISKTKPETFLKRIDIKFTPARNKCALLGFSTLKKALGEYK